MTSSEREFTMSERLLSRLKRERGVEEILCHAPSCEDAIEADDRVISKEGKSNRHYYHKGCFLATFN